MGLNETPASDRIHIGIFGKRNAGKSSIINAMTSQDLAIVSDIGGTTTDPVYKSMELLPLGPVVLIDTPGIDDEGPLGSLRVKKSYQVLNKTDIALLVTDQPRLSAQDLALLERIRSKNIPCVIAYNKCDRYPEFSPSGSSEIAVSAQKNIRIRELRELIARQYRAEDEKMRIVADLLHPSDFVVLVVPIDKAAPKGRLILPQQQTIRDVLEADAAAIVVKEYELRQTLSELGKKPRMVITDSQVFAKVSADTPTDILLTSFSILMARYKGVLEQAVAGVTAVDTLKDHDTVLISEGCTHHRQCDDIGTVKLPRWITNHTGKKLQFCFTSGTEFPDDLSPYRLIVHCGGCMQNEREMKYRMRCAKEQHVPMTNYGTLIAYMQGILKRSVEPFPHIATLLDETEEERP
ncbi:MAG: [FeFe] hydrogenase H-cluster maturation GTPase HydF [Oscillospiraceae bacterium]|nr:[FeFe] hydrogenase H-cluster maturation GTPase HydF [Oscillospiraceae bacterium]